MNITREETKVDNVTVRLIERGCCDFVILYLSTDIAAIAHQTYDRAEAHKWFATAVEIAQIGFVHPAWKQTPKRIPINAYNGD